MNPGTPPLLDPQPAQSRRETRSRHRYKIFMMRIAQLKHLQPLTQPAAESCQSQVPLCWRTGVPPVVDAAYSGATCTLGDSTEAFLFCTSHATARYPNNQDSTKAYRAGLLISAFTSHQ